ncbi:hypothetical protein KPH14_007053 [Odynerus spinipes]|uniref:Uncharacterized protein n=1 Tax=Odynerus spinipes TaxID=1348599 RepID=A0AAD9VSR7_9HYME|nr:hypothetical protein KPH14_007053 [Odynerus spinipes]
MLNWIKKSSSQEESTVSPKKSNKFSWATCRRKIAMSFSSVSKLNESIDSAIGAMDRTEEKEDHTSSSDGEKIPVNLRSLLKKPKDTDGADVMDSLERNREKRVSFLEVVECTRIKRNESEKECKKVRRIFSFGKNDTLLNGRMLSEKRVKRKLETSRDSGWESMSSLSSSSSSLISDDSDVVVRSSSPLTEVVWSQKSEGGDSSDGRRERRQLSESTSRRTTMIKCVYEKSRAWAETFKAIIPLTRKTATTTTPTTTTSTTKGRKKNKGSIMDRLRSKGRKVSFSTDTKIYDCGARLLGDYSETKDPNLGDEIYENGAIDSDNFDDFLDEPSENPFDVTTESSVGTMLFGTSLNHHRSLDDLYKLFQEEKRATSSSDSKLYVREGTAKLLSGYSPAMAIKVRSIPVESSDSKKDNERDAKLASLFSSSEDALLSGTNFDDFLSSTNEEHQRICISDSELSLEKTRRTTTLADIAKTKQETTSDPNIVSVKSTQPTSQFKRCKSLRFRRQPISKSAVEIRNDGEGDDQHDDVAEFNSLQDLTHVPPSREKLDTPELYVERQSLSFFEGSDGKEDDGHSIICESTRKRRYVENFEEREVTVMLSEEEKESVKGLTDSHNSSFIVTMYV